MMPGFRGKPHEGLLDLGSENREGYQTDEQFSRQVEHSITASYNSFPNKVVGSTRQDFHRDELSNHILATRKVYDMVSLAPARIDLGIFLADAIAKNRNRAVDV